MAGEFKIKTGLLIGPASSSQPVTKIDNNTTIPDDPSALVTAHAIRNELDNKQDSISFGSSQYYIPYTNSALDDFDYSGDFYFDPQNSFFVKGSNTNNTYYAMLRADNDEGFQFSVLGNTSDECYISSTTKYLGFFAAINHNLFFGAYKDANTFMFIRNSGGSSLTSTIKVENYDASIVLDVRESGDVYIPYIQESSQSKALYFNPTTGLVSYSDVSAGSSTLVGLTDTSIASPSSPNDTIKFDTTSAVWYNTPDFWYESSTNRVSLYDSNDDLELSAIQIDDDSGAVDLIDMDVTSSASGGTEESYGFNLDGTTIARVYAESDGAGGIQNETFKVLKSFQADASVYLKGITSAYKSKALYYDDTTKEVFYYDVSSGASGGSGDVGWNGGSVGSNNQITTAVGDGSINAEANLTFNGSELDVTGDVSISGNNIVGSYQYMGDPNTDGSWRFYIDGSGDLVFEKRVSGSWTEGGKFTV